MVQVKVISLDRLIRKSLMKIGIRFLARKKMARKKTKAIRKTTKPSHPATHLGAQDEGPRELVLDLHRHPALRSAVFVAEVDLQELVLEQQAVLLPQQRCETCVRVCVCVCVYLCLCVSVNCEVLQTDTHTHSRARTHTHTHSPTLTHTLTHTHTHTHL